MSIVTSASRRDAPERTAVPLEPFPTLPETLYDVGVMLMAILGLAFVACAVLCG